MTAVLNKMWNYSSEVTNVIKKTGETTISRDFPLKSLISAEVEEKEEKKKVRISIWKLATVNQSNFFEKSSDDKCRFKRKVEWNIFL